MKELRSAQREGKYKGQKPVAEMQTDRILELARTGMIKQAIAAELKISVLRNRKDFPLHSGATRLCEELSGDYPRIGLLV